MPSANSAIRDEAAAGEEVQVAEDAEPPNCFWMLLTAVRLTPGTGTWEPRR